MIILALVLPLSVFSQDDDLEGLGFEETEFNQKEVFNYFGVGVGFTTTFLFLNFDDLNSHLTANNFGVDELSGTMTMYGGEGFLPTLVVPNLKIGIFGRGGSIISEKELNIDNEKYTRSVEFSLSYTGISFDYAIRLWKGGALLPSLNLGYGIISVETYQGNEFIWGNVKPVSNPNHFQNTADAGFFFLQPNINLEVAATDFLMIKASAGYSMTMIGEVLTSDWKYNNASNLSGVPSGINGNGINAQIGLYLGIFNF